jgi:stalled ribosome alternative rescue factor ArfA
MKREIISFKIEPIKHRVHKALFDEDLPFKHKVEKPKKGQHIRRPKHRNKFASWEDK